VERSGPDESSMGGNRGILAKDVRRRRRSGAEMQLKPDDGIIPEKVRKRKRAIVALLTGRRSSAASAERSVNLPKKVWDESTKRNGHCGKVARSGEHNRQIRRADRELAGSEGTVGRSGGGKASTQT